MPIEVNASLANNLKIYIILLITKLPKKIGKKGFINLIGFVLNVVLEILLEDQNVFNVRKKEQIQVKMITEEKVK